MHLYYCPVCFSFVDVITIDKTGENFRLMFDVKGRFTVHRISAEEAKVTYTARSSNNVVTDVLTSSLSLIV